MFATSFNFKSFKSQLLKKIEEFQLETQDLASKARQKLIYKKEFATKIGKEKVEKKIYEIERFVRQRISDLLTSRDIGRKRLSFCVSSSDTNFAGRRFLAR